MCVYIYRDHNFYIIFNGYLTIFLASYHVIKRSCYFAISEANLRYRELNDALERTQGQLRDAGVSY